MTEYAGKLWYQDAANQLATKAAQRALEGLGQALPCRVTAVIGSIVTVAFEVTNWPQTLPQVKMPKAEGPWIRSPTQIGDFGLTVPSRAYLGGISGLGGGTAGYARRGNLSALAWVPVASTAFTAVNPNAAYVSGPQGAVVATEDGTVSMVLSETGIVFTVGGKIWSFTAAGFTMSDAIVAETHGHDYLPGGGALTRTTGPVT